MSEALKVEGGLPPQGFKREILYNTAEILQIYDSIIERTSFYEIT